jgi:hypothetical protein
MAWRPPVQPIYINNTIAIRQPANFFAVLTVHYWGNGHKTLNLRDWNLNFIPDSIMGGSKIPALNQQI